MQKFKMWIGGQFVEADDGKTFATHNPATGEEIAQVPLAGKSDVDKAVAAARKAFPAWSRKTQLERSNTVNKIAAAIREHSEELAGLEVLEHGATLGHAPSMIEFSAQNMELAAAGARTLMGQVLPNIPNKDNIAAPNTIMYLKREPVGVCALRAPEPG